jgi:predicted ATPase/DNA-binding winged helix-turn-helix (wHTH) protein
MGDRVQGSTRGIDAGPGADGTIAFGPFRMHASQRWIERDGNRLVLGGRPFDILIALIEQAGTVVSKHELLRRVWPGVDADGASLRAHIASLRKALGDGEAGVRYLTTVSGQGYCFVAPVSQSGGTEPVPVAPAAPSTHNLPSPPLGIVGREETIDEIARKVTSCRFVTVVGPGGIGKTTVAISAGHALLTQFGGQVRFVDLGAIRDDALVPSVAASVLGMPARSSDPSDGLLAFIRDKRMLLILDCCEHVIDSAAALAERLYQEAPQLHILATSREFLRVEGEHIHRLSPLASPPEDAALTAAEVLAFPAVRLLVERAQAGGGDFVLTDANAPDVGKICRQLDGIALAIELAASRFSAYGVGQMIELLSNQFNLLWEGRRTALPRHRTLRATIDWSYNLLSGPERAVLCRLSVFVGNFTLEAAQAVAAGDDADEAVAAIAFANLVAKSMLTSSADGSPQRYRLLDATRTYAQEKLTSSPEAPLTARRHASYFLDLLASIGDDPGERHAEIADQFGNIRAALTWCFGDAGDRALGVRLAAASMPFLMHLSLYAECQLWAERATGSGGDASRDDGHALSLYTALGAARMLTGQIDEETAACLDRAFALAEAAGDAKRQLRLIDRLHLLHVLAGKLDAAMDVARRGEAIAAASGEPAALARMRLSLGISHQFLGNIAASSDYVDTALAQADLLEADASNPLIFAYPSRAEITKARIHWLQGYPDQAMDTVQRAMSRLMATDDPVKLSRGVLWAYAVFFWNSETDKCDPYVDRLLREARRHDLRALQMVGEAMKGVALTASGDFEVGLAKLRESVVNMHRHRFGPVTDFSIPLADALATVGHSEEALGWLDRTIERARSCNFLLDMPDLLRVKGEVLASMDASNHGQAEQCITQSLDLARRQGALGFELRSAVSLARLWQGQGRHQEARMMLAPVYARFTEGFDTRLLKTARTLLDGLDPPRSSAVAIR